MKSLNRLKRSELPHQTLALAKYLIGKTLVHDTPRGRKVGRIVETEAYLPYDASSHSFRGRTTRNSSMFLKHGHAYVYFIYGTWFALNVVSGKPGVGAAVLIRALEPLEGISQVPRGPGRLTTILKINRRYDGIDLCRDRRLWLAHAVRPVGCIGRSVRIGISKETHRKWRFYERGNTCVSGSKELNR